MDQIRIGTRGSALALVQAKLVVDALKERDGSLEVLTVIVKTEGDLLPPDRRAGIDGKSAFTGALETELMRGKIDAAVHSYKDLPAEIGRGLVIAATPPRGDPRDALVSKGEKSLEEMPKGATIGTSSLRRRAQILNLRKDLKVVELHGNVETRIGKVQGSGLDGVVLAAAGLQRLGLGPKISDYFDPEKIVPAVCQGTIAVQSRDENSWIRKVLEAVDDRTTRQASDCEREFSRKLGGDCYVPLGALAKVDGNDLGAVGLVADPEGSEVVKGRVRGSATDGTSLGGKLADQVLSAGGESILGGLGK